MTTQAISSGQVKINGATHFLTNLSQPKNRQAGNLRLLSFNKQMFEWKNLATKFPLVHLLQPDFYTVFQFSSPESPIFEKNLHLDLGTSDVNYESLKSWIHQDDLEHMNRIDKVIIRFSFECLLQPFDFISSVIIQLNHPEKGKLYFIRKTAILKCDESGLPSYGIMTLKDVTAMVTTCKPNNIDITFSPQQANLCHEIWKRINAVQPKRISITPREKEIVNCLYNGMSSKEIANVLYISKATVDTHRQNLIHKWEVSNTAGLMKRAVEEGCI